MSLRIIDRPGAMPVERMRLLFEQAVQGTTSLRHNTPLGTVTINGAFSHYFAADTDTLWIGFALGLRCAERMATAQGFFP